jgi:hypothetical protein|tara:strand:+ start:69 stop:419 length:351 start_codon:yes stop_codon:yes gene_type:complete
MKLKDILSQEEGLLGQIVKDFGRIKSNLLKYTNLLSLESESEMDDDPDSEMDDLLSMVSESEEEIPFDEDRIYQIISMIDDVSLDLKRFHRQKSRKKEVEYRDDDLEKDTIYRVKK